MTEYSISYLIIGFVGKVASVSRNQFHQNELFSNRLRAVFAFGKPHI
jgi:hypothetical protein